MSITIKYYGHSCFSVTDGEHTAVFDPYAPGYVPGLGDVDITADAVYCSHGHGDHNYAQAVKLSGKDPFTVDTITCPHDDAGGAKRGMNTIHILHIDGKRVVHMGDVGCTLPESDMAKLRGADVLLIPVGGFYTIDAKTADAIARDMGTAVVIPMHYRTAGAGFDVIAPVEDFLALRENVQRFGDSLSLDNVTAPVTAVLRQALAG